MKKFLAAALFVFSISPAFSFDLQSTGLAGVREMAPAAAEVPVPAAAKAVSEHLWMGVRQNPSFKEAQADDWGARIETRVRETFKDSYDVNLRADSEYSWASIRKSGESYYNMSGSGLFLSMSGSNGSYFVNGTVTENGRTTHISANLSRRFDDYSYNVSAFGLNLYTDRNSINGSYDPERFPKKAVAAVASLILAVQVEKGQAAPREKSAGYNQRIWLSVSPGSAGNTVEARDPFARINVGLRKIFDKTYDAEIETSGGRQWGRVSNFFARRYELRAGRTDLRLEEWAGNLQLSGTVEVNRPEQEEQGVRLELRERFGDGSFYIRQDGIYLTIDRGGISGEIDTKIYPREVIAALTSLVLAYYQETPLQPG